MTHPRLGTIAVTCAAVLAGACMQTSHSPVIASRAPGLEADAPQSPPGAREGTCWHRDVTPAVIETETRQVIVQPAQVDSTGRIISPAVWRTERAPRILHERTEKWIETPCPGQMGPGFTQSLQRALAARGHFRGQISGTLDRSTRRAIRTYQALHGLDSHVLSLASAQRLGLVVVDLPPRS